MYHTDIRGSPPSVDGDRQNTDRILNTVFAFRFPFQTYRFGTNTGKARPDGMYVFMCPSKYTDARSLGIRSARRGSLPGSRTELRIAQHADQASDSTNQTRLPPQR